MRNGIDWEKPDKDDPWAYIGYWGDHQIIYLQKLLELSNNFHPNKLNELLTKEIFSYANVPYRIKSHKEIVKNPKSTINFDYDENKKISTLVEKIGADGRLLLNKNNNIFHMFFLLWVKVCKCLICSNITRFYFEKFAQFSSS